ncbi:MAG TPA: ribosome silencing factor [Phycisphaerales bacterium]|nr:ribosome silencing factor [Phycisphaerales bacterium]
MAKRPEKKKAPKTTPKAASKTTTKAAARKPSPKPARSKPSKPKPAATRSASARPAPKKPTVQPAAKLATKAPAKKRATSRKASGPIVLETEVIELPDAPAVPAVREASRPPAAPTAPIHPGDAAGFAMAVARLCRDDHCEDVMVLDVRALSSVADYIVIASGTSDRQMRSVLRHAEELGQSVGSPAFKTSSDDRATWLIADFVDVVVHLFEPNTRSHYDLEMLWGDAPRVAWERADQMERDRAGLASN